MSACALQPATRSIDHHRLSELARLIWHEHYPDIIGIEQIEYMLATGYGLDTLATEQAAGTRFVLAWVGETTAGFAGVSPDGQDPALAWLDKLYVRAENRGQGVGRRLLDWARSAARELDADYLCLRVNRGNSGAIAVYEHAGFTIEGEHVKPIGGGFVMDDYIMRQTLPPVP
jgi:GNAT superfamily N-acetyltransferase